MTYWSKIHFWQCSIISVSMDDQDVCAWRSNHKVDLSPEEFW